MAVGLQGAPTDRDSQGDVGTEEDRSELPTPRALSEPNSSRDPAKFAGKRAVAADPSGLRSCKPPAVADPSGEIGVEACHRGTMSGRLSSPPVGEPGTVDACPKDDPPNVRTGPKATLEPGIRAW